MHCFNCLTFLRMIALIVFLSGCSAPHGSNNGARPTIVSPQGPGRSEGEAVVTGGWESSGGGGIACFHSVQSAKRARKDISSLGYLNADTRKEISTVATLDRMESWHPLEQSLKSVTTAQVILKSIQQNMEDEVPLFLQRLKMVQHHFPFEKWKTSEQIPLIKDSTPSPLIKKEIDKNSRCVLVQLANRLTKSSANRLPETEIYYDPILFHFLDPLDQAMLISHEYLYLIGKETRHLNSDGIRRLNSFFFSKSFFDLRKGYLKLSERALRLRVTIGDFFGDYMRFFIDEPELQNGVPQVGSPYSRYQSLISLMKKMRSSMEQCLKEQESSSKKSPDKKFSAQNPCQRKVVENNPGLWATLSDEEAFLYVGRFHFDQLTWDFNSELLTVWSPNPATHNSLLEKQAGLLYLQCHEMVKKPALQFLEVQEVAKRYCREIIGMPVPLLSETPLYRRFHCHSEKDGVIFFNGEHSRFGIADDADPITGAIAHPFRFQGGKELISSLKGHVTRDYGLQNIEYYSKDTYRLTPANEPDRNQIRKLILQEPTVLTDLVVRRERAGAKERWNSADSELITLLYSAEKFEIVSFETLLSCQITESRLPESAWWYH